MRRRSLLFINLIAVGCAGCVDGFRGSNLEVDLSNGTPAQASPGIVPRADQLPSNVHFTIYGIQEAADRDHLFALDQFEIHPIVDLASPCFIDVGDHVPHPGLHVSQFAKQIALDTGIPDVRNPPAGATEQQKIIAATAEQRMTNITALGSDQGIKAVTSVSATAYPAVAADCDGPAGELPPPTCTDDASNQRRLALCQAAWSADPDLWEGTDRVLTAPLGGRTFGLVDGVNPVNLGPVGGAQFFVEQAVSTVDAYAIYWQVDGTAGPGTLLYFGRPTQPTRGVDHVHMTSPRSPALSADMIVFADLGEDNVHF